MLQGNKLCAIAVAISAGLSSSAISQPLVFEKVSTLPITHSSSRIVAAPGAAAITQLTRYQVAQFIIELHDQPLVTTRKIASARAGKGSTAKGHIRNAIEQQRKAIGDAQQRLIDELQQKDLVQKVLRKNQKIHNSIVVEADWRDIRYLTNHTAVKSIQPVRVVQKLLHESTSLINADEAWSLTDSENQNLTGTGITVAIMDTGVDYNHADLGGCLGAECKVIGGYDFVEQDEDPMDVDGHGTHVAGIVAASGSVTGVAPGASIMALRVLDDEGFGSTSDIIAALEYAVDPDGDLLTDDAPDIINMSLGAPGDFESATSVAVNNTVDAGIVVVAAAGNYAGYGDIAALSPSSALNAITVSSSTKEDTISGFTSRGGGASYQQLKPEIIAPGSDIVSLEVDGGTLSLSGTSMAAPHVAGAAAILKQNYPEASPAEIKARLITSAVDIGADPYTQGYGRLDVTAALAQTVLLIDAGLAFGRVDDTLNEVEYSAFVELQNDSNSEVNFDISLPQAMPEQVSIQLEQSSIQVPANETVRLEFTVLVSSPGEIETPNNVSTSYFDLLSFSSEEQTISVPVTLERGYRLSLTHDGLNPAGLSVDSVDGISFAFDYIFPEETRTIFTPETKLYIRVEHELEESEISHLDIPGREDGIKTYVEGYEEHVVDMDGSYSINLSPSNLTHLVGLAEAKNRAGEDVLTTALSNNTNLFSFIQFSNEVGALSVEYRSQIFFDSLDAEKQTASYLALGNLSDEIDSRFEDNVRFPELRSQDSDTFVQMVYDLNDTQDLLLSFEEGLKSEITFSGFSGSGTPFVAADLADNSFTLPVFYFATDKDVVHFTQLTSSTFGGVSARLHLGNQSESGTGWLTPAATSQDLSFTNSAEESVYAINVNEDQSYEFANSGLTLSKPIEVWTNYIMALRGFHFSNGSGQTFHSGLQANYRVSCESGESIDGLYDAENYLFVTTAGCDATGIAFTWQTDLQGESYSSSATYTMTPDTAPTFPGLRTAVFEDGVLNKDSTLEGKEHWLYLAPDAEFVTLNLGTLEVKLDDGEWQSLTFESADSAQFNHMALLPSVGTGDQVLSFRVTYSDGSNIGEVVQEINGAYVLTMPAAESDLDDDGIPDSQDSDIDGDGIPNDVETEYGLDPLNSDDANEDLDNDGLTNLEEYLTGTLLDNPDSDSDGIIDGDDENPLIAVSSAAIAHDYDGDGKADVGVRRPSNYHQYISGSSDGEIMREQFGRALNDIPVSGDFDGDGIADVAVRRPSNQFWYIKNSSDGAIQRFNFGLQAEDIPVPADYDGDGITDIAVRRPSNQFWYIKNSSDGEIQRFNFGLQETDIPVPADYDGDGITDIAVRRPSNFTWYILRSSDGEIERKVFGRDEDDIPVPADYDGDGKADVAVRRASNQMFYILNSSDNEIQRINFGQQAQDIPIVADYDGDGKADVAVRRPSTQFQYILRSSDGEIERLQFGRNSGDIPLAGPILTRMSMAENASN
ncbi:S8 family serine peptidase [Planctobacterium marinum]|uniref:Peptidase S8/S53 domain-containing protein n=1 Tax=Planctobacterium marinum TaxID=1631968 RepID=A0AA48HIH6_9ALTE|nr:hypothetical protein MACH26_14400 [Planctobacterium marinum]